MIGAFGDKQLLTPTATMIPAVCAKIVSCLDPWLVKSLNNCARQIIRNVIHRVYAISHPRYRSVLEKKCPWLGIKEDLHENTDAKSAVTTGTTET